MKKIFNFLIMFLLVISLSSVNSKQANAYDLCSGLTRCAGTTLTYGVDKTNSSKTVYFSKGEKIWFSWSNSSPGIFHTNVAIYEGTTKIYGYHTIPQLGQDFDYTNAPHSGYYHLVVTCSDGTGEKRCEGEGSIFYQ